MIVNCQRRIRVALTPLAGFLEEVRRALRFPQESVAVQLVSDSAMAKLNLKFRDKKGSTDVLSFPALAENSRRLRTARGRAGVSEKRESHIGDIAIAPQTARRNARLYSRSLDEELRILILHGMIHLAGYDHETDHGQMARVERRLRRRFRLSLS
jgi:probable rRNA maturation factor